MTNEQSNKTNGTAAAANPPQAMQLPFIDMDKAAKYSGWIHKEKHGPTSYSAYSREPVLGPEGGNMYIAAVFHRTKNSRGMHRRVPVKIAAFKRQREAAATALMWHCQLEGLEIKDLHAGSLTRQQRQDLLAQLGVRRQRIRLNAAAIVFPACEPAVEPEIAQAAELELVANAAADAIGESLSQAAEPMTSAAASGGARVVGNVTNSLWARVVGAIARVLRSFMNRFKARRVADGEDTCTLAVDGLDDTNVRETR